MTGIVLRDLSASANYRNGALGWSGLPISAAGLEVAHFFGYTLAQSLRNFAPGKGDSIATGVPVVNANSIELQGGTSFLTTAMADSLSTTLVIAYRMLDDANAFAFANTIATDTTANRKTALYVSMATASDGLVVPTALRASNTVGLTLATGAALAVNTPMCQTLRFDTAEGILYGANLTTGVGGSVASGGTRTLGSPLRIGSAYQAAGTYTGRSEVYAALGFSRKLSDAELATLYQYLKAYAARRSITV